MEVVSSGDEQVPGSRLCHLLHLSKDLFSPALSGCLLRLVTLLFLARVAFTHFALGNPVRSSLRAIVAFKNSSSSGFQASGSCGGPPQEPDAWKPEDDEFLKAKTWYWNALDIPYGYLT